MLWNSVSKQFVNEGGNPYLYEVYACFNVLNLSKSTIYASVMGIEGTTIAFLCSTY